MEADIADRFVTVEYKTYASRSVRREIRRRCDVTCRVYNQLLDNALTALAEDGHVPDRYGMQTMITQMRAEDALIRSVKVDTLRDASDRLTRAFHGCRSKSARDGKPHSPRRKTPSRYRSVPLPVASFKIDDEHIVLDGEMRMRYRNRHRPKGGEPVAVRAILRDDDLFINVTYSIKPEHHLFRGGFDMDADGFEGYDFGLVDIITDTHGGKIQAPDFYARREKDIARLQRQIAAGGGQPQAQEEGEAAGQDLRGDPSQARRIPGASGRRYARRQIRRGYRGSEGKEDDREGGQHRPQKETLHRGRIGVPDAETGA